MPTNSYDLIVVGDDFAGLVAGTLCARRGMRVLLLAHGGRPSSYVLGPHRLPVDPLSLAGLGSPMVQRVLDELQIGHALKRKLDQRPVAFQLVTPDVRLDVSADEHVLATELRRELPEAMAASSEPGAEADQGPGEDAEAVDALRACTGSAAVARHFDVAMGADGEFPPLGFWKRREVGKSAGRLTEEADAWLARASAHPVVRALVSLPAVLDTGLGVDDLGAAACARGFHMWRTGASRMRGDWEALRELFVERLTKASGETRAARAEALTYRWGRVNGVRLENGEELGAGHVIAALPLDELVPLVGRKIPKRLTQCAEAMRVSGYRYTWNLVVDEAGVPEGMSSPLLLVADPDAPLMGDNAVAVYLDAPDDEGRVVVSISAVCPPPAEDQDGRALATALADLRRRLRERVGMVMPFLDEHVLVSHSPHEAAPPEGIHAAAAKGLPIEPTPVWSSSLEAAMGVSAVPYGVGIKHLTVASSQVLPGLGLEGGFAAGWSAARLASESTGKKREYREVLASGS